MTIRRILIAVLLAVIILPTAAIALFIAQFNPNRYAPAFIASIEKATGRQLTIGGPIKISLSLTPKISADNVSLANPPGFADTNLVTINQLQAKIDLLPLILHQIVIEKLIILRPQITLETSDNGKADWDLTPTAAPPAAFTATPAPPPGPRLSRYKIALEAVEIQDASIVIRRTHAPNSITINLASLTGSAASASAPLNLNAQASFNNVPFALSGVVGPVERFSGAGSGPWPVKLTLSSNGATASIDGKVNEPRNFGGYDLAVKFNIPALEMLGAGLPNGIINQAAIPPIHGIAGSAELVDQHSLIPAINDLTIKAAASGLSAFRPGLALDTFDIEAPALTSPVSVNATGAMGTTPITLAGHFGPLSQLINPAWLPPTSSPPPPNFPVSVQAQLGNAKLGIDGSIATPITLEGAALNSNLSIPDLSSFSPLAGTALPAWKNITAQGTLIDPGGLGLVNAIGIDSLVLTMDNAALGGDVSWYFGNHPRLQLALRAQQINLDSLLAQLPSAPAKPTPVPPAAPAPAPPQTNALLPQIKLPLALLKTASADIQLAADTLIFNQTTYTAIQGHAVLANAVLTINPLTAVLPGGGITANATIDATKDPATVTLALNAPALALSPFLQAFGLPSAAMGTLQAGLSLSGTGDTSQDLMNTLNGQLGMAMVNGTVDGDVLRRVFGAALSAIDLPASLVGGQGPVAVRCFGLRVDSQNGIGQISALTLDSSRLLVEGGGSLNFGNETLGIILRPQLRVAGNEISVPIKIGGTFAAPTASVAPLAAVQEAGKTAVGLTISLADEIPGGSTLLGKIETSLGIGGSTTDVCPAALSLARLGKPGPAAPPETASSSPSATGQTPNTGPKNLLNVLLGK